MNNTKEKTPIKRFRKLGFSHLDTLEIVTQLNKLLSNYAVHFQKLKNFHWNVQGGDFFELHEKFEELANQNRHNIDAVAERIRVFDKIPYSNFSQFLEVAEIKEPNYGLSAYQMVQEIIQDFEILINAQNNVMDAALTIGDSGTINLVNTHIETMEKDFWMLSSWLKNG